MSLREKIRLFCAVGEEILCHVCNCPYDELQAPEDTDYEITAKVAAEILGITRQTMNAWAKVGHGTKGVTIKSRVEENGYRYFNREHIEEVAAELRIEEQS